EEPVPQAPALTSTKAVTGNADEDGNGAVSVGDTLTYAVTVTNTGNIDLVNVVVSDVKLTPTTITCATLAPKATCVLTGTYKVQQADGNAGKVVNTATVKTDTPNTCPLGSPDPQCNPKHEEPVPQAPALTSTKAVTGNADEDGNGTVSVGDTLTYAVTVTNTGNIDLVNVVVSDVKLTPTTITCATLAPKATCVLTGTYKVQQADGNAGKVVNTATVKTDTPNTCPLGSPDPQCNPKHEEPVPQAPALTSTKAVTGNADEDGNGAVSVGDTLTYAVTVTNTGNVDLVNVVVSDVKLTPNTITCATLAPKATCVLTGTYKVQQADGNAGKVVNTATVKTDTPNTCPLGSPDPQCNPKHEEPVPQAPALTSTKAVTGNADEDGNGAVSVGDTLTYAVTVTNTGNIDLVNVVVSDVKLTPNTITCATLAPKATCVLTGTYKVQQADGNAGKVVNTATVKTDTPNTCPLGSPDPQCNPKHEEPVPQAPALTSTKAVTGNADEDGNGTVSVGDTLTYAVTVTNTGNVDLVNVVVSDVKLTPNTITCATLAPKATCVLTGTYKVQQADGNAGKVVNTATVKTDTPNTCPPGSPDPQCNPKHEEPVPQAPALTSTKAVTGNADEDGNGAVSVGDTLTYAVTVTNTGNVDLVNVVVSDVKLTPNTITCATLAPKATCVLTGTYKVQQADADVGGVVNVATVKTDTPNTCPPGSPDPNCNPTVTTPIEARPAVAIVKVATLTVDQGTQGVGNVGDVITYTVRITNTGNITLNDMGTSDVLETYPATSLNCGATTLAPGASTDCNPYTHTITRDEANAGGTLDNVVTVTARYGGGGSGGGGSTSGTATAQGLALMPVEPEETADLFVSKQVNPRDVKIGDLVRYTVTIKNIGITDAIDATLTDTPPAGFTLVEGSLQVADRDGAGRQVGSYPIKVDQIDIKAGDSATVVYLLRVGAGVRPGTHINHAYAEDGGKRSNEATAEVRLVADPLLDESLLVGTVFDDRDEDGWQDPADLTQVRVQGGFAADAYVANSTTVDRGDGAKPEPDASSPMLHGIALGKIAGRQSEADPVAKHEVVISQLLREAKFSDDFVLTTAQGVTLRMDAAGNTRVERDGDAAKGLTGADPKVERRIAQTQGGYRVDYVVSNHGIDEHGIPGVRVASVEGLLIETDQFGRYHLEGVSGGAWERGRNFILKVDPATLPPGAKLTTDNPLVRRLTPGVPVRFDFGVKMPPGQTTQTEQVEMRIGEVLFTPNSAEVTPAYLPAVENMAAKVKEYGGGEIVITANGESEALAMDRALAVRKSLEGMIDPQLLKSVQVSVRTDVTDPTSMVVGFAEWPLLGTVLFDTDKATIKPKFEPVIAKIAAAMEQLRGTRVIITGHTDLRASDAYNVDLGLRRAKAVFDAIVAHASPDLRQHLRVDISNDPAAPADKPGK
ncbi:OmpA family protein, partial [Lysobacter gummosus]